MPAPPVRSWSDAPPAALCAVAGVLTDIDDTLTNRGEIEPAALQALQALHRAGLPVIAVTGRPQGWSEPFAQAWPLAAIVAENGAVMLCREDGALHIEYAQDAGTREINARRLRAAAARVLGEVPGATLSRDSGGRVTDIAIDHGEFASLDAAAIERIVQVMREEGLTATVSSIHVNGWIGAHDKLSGARWAVRRRLGRDLEAERARWVYVGDSPNDQAMFRHFPLAVGVANLRDFAAQLAHWPAFLTEGARGEGFAEVARALLAARP